MRGTALGRTIIPAGIVFLVTACAGTGGGGDTTTTTGTVVVAEPDSTSTSTSSTSSTLPRPETATKFVDEAPPGSIRVDMQLAPFRFEPDELTVRAGDEAVFFLVNMAPETNEVPTHNFAIGPRVRESMAVSSVLLPGQSAAFTVKGLEEGEYVFWCTVYDHAQQGMVGVLTVDA